MQADHPCYPCNALYIAMYDFQTVELKLTHLSTFNMLHVLQNSVKSQS